MSASSSSNSSFTNAITINNSTNNNNNNNNNGYNLIASLSLTSLANVSIFENEEYFSYFNKLMEQFNFIEFNLTISKDKTFNQKVYNTTSNNTNNNNVNITEQVKIKPARKSSSSLSRNDSSQGQKSMQSITTSPSTPNATISYNNNNNNNNNNHSVFNLKNISKRLNIKSWFTSSSSSNTQQQSQPKQYSNSTLPSMSMHNMKQHTKSSNTLGFNSNNKPKLPNTAPQVITSQQQQPQHQVFKKASKLNNKNNKGSNNNNLKKLNATSLMKHSLSEPSLNEVIE